MRATGRVSGLELNRLDGVRRYFAAMADAWQEWHIELGEIREVGQDTVLTHLTFRAGGMSGVEVEARTDQSQTPESD